ncbi:MAG: L-threonine 3-dehydrogenase [Pseudolabrys sp.]|jgi:threonine 3-dehydrogenase|nr:L-threonine 3-dehydrogenase [Pseudolabrys sp.]
MLALSKVTQGENGLALVDHAEPQIGPGQVLIRIEASGICGTDIQIYKWAPRMARRMTLPRVLGHEGSGVVVGVGQGVNRVKVGDHVSLESHIFCGECHQCKTDRAHLCVNTRYPGVDIDGCFARYVVVPEQIAWVHPEPIPFEQAAIFEPFGIAMHVCNEGRGVASLPVLVSGCGPIGLMAVATARALGARKVIAVDPIAIRRRAAIELGADAALDPTTHDIVAEVKALTAGQGVEVAIEFSGTEPGFRTALDCVTKGGEFRLVGAPALPIEIDLTRWLLQCPTIYNIHGRRIWRSWDQLWALFKSGKIDLRPVISHVLPLSEGITGFDLIRKGEALKPILIPS